MFVEIEKRSKKARKEYYASLRKTNGFNTGTRNMKTPKNPSRAEQKENFRKMVDKAF